MKLAEPLYRTADLRAVEVAASDQALMQRAGLAGADLACELCSDQGAKVLILAGPGNNGGDAFEVAYHLQRRFFDIHLVFISDPARLPADALAACQRFLTNGGRLLDRIPVEVRWSLIIDGLFGIGLQRDISGRYAELVDSANTLASQLQCSLLALDCPSGLDTDTGRLLGNSIRASHTITFIGDKPGLHTGDGPDCCGQITLARLGLGNPLPADQDSPGKIVSTTLFAAHLQPRARNSHKGSFGSIGVFGGSKGMLGAALLAGRAALKLGSGKVYLGLLDSGAPGVDPIQPELMLRRPETLLNAGLTALACGPGMGRSHEAIVLLEKACALNLPLVLDADALNLVATEGDLQVALALRAPLAAPTLFTPHPAEAARLLDTETSAIQADRIGAALEISAHFNAIVALKGCGTVIAAPDGRWFINTTGNAGLASGGTGDVLTGFVAALLAQGWPGLEAMLAAVHLHGAAADDLVVRGHGPVGLTASELIDCARSLFNGWLQNDA